MNKYLGQLGQERGIVEVRKGSLIPPGPLKESLFNSTDPFIIGVSGDQDGVSRLLTEAGILDSMSLESLDGAQEMKLSSLVTLGCWPRERPWTTWRKPPRTSTTSQSGNSMAMNYPIS